MISVCMASFNGSKYIKNQLESILAQIKHDDEIIIVDDASTDDTVFVIKSLNDNRIKIFENISIGVISSFGRSINLAQGDTIFLSDQDDVWLPTKVNKIMNIFSKNTDITLCLSDAMIVNALGKITEDSYFKQRGSFKHGAMPNIIKNKFLGCAIAFKASLIHRILPFPNNIPAHDMWIGIINEIYGKSFFINDTLFHYRSHSENVSSMEHENIFIMFRWRAALIFQLIIRVFTNYLK